MQNEIITLETAKLAKEKGFNIPVTNYINPDGVFDCVKPTTYNDDGDDNYDIDELGGTILQDYNNVEIDIGEIETWGCYFNENGIKENYSAPTQSLLQRWLREKHNLDVIVLPKLKDLGKFYGGYVDKNDQQINHSYGSNFKTYEEALEEGLYEALKLI
jgi:hypothetical protein